MLEFGEERVAVGNDGVDDGEVDAVGDGECGVKDFAAAGDEDLIIVRVQVVRMAQGLFQGGDHRCAASAKCRIAGDDDVGATGQRLADRLPGLAAHDDGMAHGASLEVPQVGGHVPGQRAPAADHAVARHRGDQGDFRFSIFDCGLAIDNRIRVNGIGMAWSRIQIPKFPESNRHRRRDVRVGMVIQQLEVFVLEIEDRLDARIDLHRGQGLGWRESCSACSR